MREGKEKKGGEKRRGGGTGGERMSGTLPACRSNMKNDVCGDRRVRMDPALHQTHYITFGYLHRSYIHAHTSPAVNHLLQQEGLCNGASLLKSPCSSKHSEIKKKKRGAPHCCAPDG